MTINVNAINAKLNYVAQAPNLKICLCQTEPATLADCTNVSGSGGKRITVEATITGELTLSDSATPGGRKLTVPSKVMTDGAIVAVDGGSADLWFAVYNDSELLLHDSVPNEAVQSGATITTPPYEYTDGQ